MKRKVIYCTHCRMWFDTNKGWQAKRGIIPSCPCCNAPLMEISYDDFIKENIEQGRLDEVMTWEYPNGAYWAKGE